MQLIFVTGKNCIKMCLSMTIHYFTLNLEYSSFYIHKYIVIMTILGKKALDSW
jgi:hypothetical protein